MTVRRAAVGTFSLLLVGALPSTTSSLLPGTTLGFLRATTKAARPVIARRAYSSTRTATMSSSKHDLVVDDFCMRQFSPDYGGTRIEMNPKEFEAKVNEFYRQHPTLHEGYAPFCKHVFMPNFAGLTSGTAPITPENEPHLRSVYEARTEKELPVLIRFFPKELVPPKPAAFLDVILYSREQIRKENADMGNPDRPEQEDAPWGIISVKAQDVDHELPMQPITMLRNALGREYGGSGVALDKAKYQESVDFWSKNAIIR